MTIETIDMAPSPAATRRLLQTIIDDSTNTDDVAWARAELLRCFPPVVVAVDQIHKYLIVPVPGDPISATKSRLDYYCRAIAGRHGAGNCDIYEFPEQNKRLRDIVDFLQADDCTIMHFDYRGQLMPGAK